MPKAPSTEYRELIERVAAGPGVRFVRISVAEVARSAGLSESLVRRFVRGQRVGARSAQRLRGVLGIEPSSTAESPP